MWRELSFMLGPSTALFFFPQALLVKRATLRAKIEVGRTQLPEFPDILYFLGLFASYGADELRQARQNCHHLCPDVGLQPGVSRPAPLAIIGLK